jgi:hypothetical protein
MTSRGALEDFSGNPTNQAFKLIPHIILCNYWFASISVD